jgi:hypothetical protein
MGARAGWGGRLGGTWGCEEDEPGQGDAGGRIHTAERIPIAVASVPVRIAPLGSSFAGRWLQIHHP